MVVCILHGSITMTLKNKKLIWLKVPLKISHEISNNLSELEFKIHDYTDAGNGSKLIRICVEIINQEQENLLKILYSDYIKASGDFGKV